MRHGKLLIDGRWEDSEDRTDVHNPYDNSVIGTTARARPEQVTRAIDAARAAHRTGPPPAHERAAILDRARTLMATRADELTRTIAEEAGKPVKTAAVEVARCQDTLLFTAVEIRKLAGKMVPLDASSNGEGKLGFTIQRPKGVVAAITPFNFPLNLVAHKLAPAFAAGCPVMCKPAEDTPFTALALAEILVEAGMPDGFLAMLTGKAAEVGGAIAEAADVITFTGSNAVGKQIAAANPGKTILLELGSNAPVIVDATADLDHAVDRLAATGYTHAGQSCVSAQRIYVEHAVKDALVERLVERTRGLKVGDPLDPETDVGPLIRPRDRERVKEWIDEAVEQGAKLRHGGQINPDGTLQPTVLDDVTPDMKVSCQEVFGPVLAVQGVQDVDEAIALSNDSRFGLHAGIFTQDHTAALKAATRLQFGGVLVNESPTWRADQQPYGGVRESGNTREGPAWAIHDYLEETVVIFQLPTG